MKNKRLPRIDFFHFPNICTNVLKIKINLLCILYYISKTHHDCIMRWQPWTIRVRNCHDDQIFLRRISIHVPGVFTVGHRKHCRKIYTSKKKTLFFTTSNNNHVTEPLLRLMLVQEKYFTIRPPFLKLSRRICSKVRLVFSSRASYWLSRYSLSRITAAILMK